MEKQLRRLIPAPIEADEQIRRTVIPTPRSTSMIHGWGVRF